MKKVVDIRERASYHVEAGTVRLCLMVHLVSGDPKNFSK